ncbi:MAG: NAD(P)-dependent oxidoreductase [Intestinibacter sp.]
MINNLQEAQNCLLCKKPRCQKNCPINTPIPQIIELYKNGEIEKAGDILFNNNPLSAICAIVCPHEKQCRGNCIRGIKKEPVYFNSIEQEISKKYLENTKFTKPKGNGTKVAIVGSGPAGLTVAFELARKGYDITIFEKNERIGGVLAYGIPDFRLPKELVDLLIQRLLELGVKIKINSIVGPVITLNKLFKDGYKAIFIGTGVWNPKRLDIKGETFGHSHYAIDYLKSPKYYSLGKRVVVVGAGNVAMDAARTAKKNGAEEVYITYRRDFEDMTATKHEIHDAKQEGILFKTFEAPVEIVDEGIVLARTEKIEVDGKTTVATIPDSEYLFECDSILIAVSQAPKNTIVVNNKGVDITKRGYIETDDKGLTTREGVFACGDVVLGASTVIQAVNSAKIVSNSIDKYLQELTQEKEIVV